MATVKKRDMSAIAAAAAGRSPSIEDRLKHAQSVVSEHPADETSEPIPVPRTQIATATQRTASGARLVSAPLSEIDENPFNARKVYKPQRIKDLATSLAAHGQEQPGIATIRGGRYVLAAGHYRLKSLHVIAAKSMDLLVYDNMTDQDLYAYSYRENAERETQTALDNALAWQELLKQGVYENETAIAEATGQSLPNVNKTLRALTLSTQTLDEIKEDPSAFAMSVLYELALFEEKAGALRSLELARLVRAGEAGRKEIQEARARVESPRERKAKETSRQYKIIRDGQPLGQLKDWDSGKVSFEVQLADPKERAALVEELRQRFGLVE